MEIDDENKLTRFTKKKTVASDHNNLFLYLDIKLPQTSKRMQIYKLNDSEALAAFKEETSLHSKLSECFLKPNNVIQQTID